jgi:hypothetical protein
MWTGLAERLGLDAARACACRIVFRMDLSASLEEEPGVAMEEKSAGNPSGRAWWVREGDLFASIAFSSARTLSSNALMRLTSANLTRLRGS